MNKYAGIKVVDNLSNFEREKPTVMVVDDEGSVLKTTEVLLEEEGYLVKLCPTGKEAIDKLDKGIHAVVLDIDMPDITGLEVFEKIKAKNPYVPIIFHTGVATKREDRRDIRRQFKPHAYVIKGSDPEQLLDTVASAVESYGNILRNVRFSEDLYKELQQSSDKLRTNMEGTIQAMALTVEIRDPYTAGHQLRVADLACVIAKEMNLSKDQIEGIQMAGIIHDVGKIQIPAEILNKSGPLSEIELSMIKTHPQVGYDILKKIEFKWPIAKIVYQHHEKIDGSGYPLGLKGDEILLESKILCVADVVEAMTLHRPYRPALGVDQALDEIVQNKGILYDTRVVDACLLDFRKEGFKFD
ncbi:MAG: HD domain-containing protein [Candidatus Scalindua sp.]|nr:HD domain-containing protein [Candidatus Scalindua sp.]